MPSSFIFMPMVLCHYGLSPAAAPRGFEVAQYRLFTVQLTLVWVISNESPRRQLLDPKSVSTACISSTSGFLMQYSWTLSEFGELLSVYNQVPTLAMKVANQPNRNTIWMR